MAVQASISAADNWFVGEAKVLRFTVALPDGIDDFVDWALRYRLVDAAGEILIEKNSADNEVVASEVAAIAPVEDDPETDEDETVVGVAAIRYATVQITAEDTEDLEPRAYQHTLWRTDPGSEAVLAYGDAVLRDPEDT